MAFTDADVTSLKAAIAQGALRVRFGDQEVMYRSLVEMRQTLAMMEAELNGVSGKRQARQVRFQTGKGLA